MTTRFFKTTIIASIFILILCSFMPLQWLDVDMGDQRSDLVSILGQSTTHENWDMKGDTWEANTFFDKWRLHVSYKNNNAYFVQYTVDVLWHPYDQRLYLYTKADYIRPGRKWFL